MVIIVIWLAPHVSVSPVTTAMQYVCFRLSLVPSSVTCCPDKHRHFLPPHVMTSQASMRSVTRLSGRVGDMKRVSEAKLQEEYRQLVAGLGLGAGAGGMDVDTGAATGAAATGAAGGGRSLADEVLGSPVLPDDILMEAVPGQVSV